MVEECLGRGQVWKDCGSNCTGTCDEPNPVCSEECVPRCQCPSDQPLLQNGECVREEACQRRLTENPKECAGGQVWHDCGSNCTSTCEDKDPVCSDACVPRCQCPLEMPVWRNGECIAEYSCETPEEAMVEECLGRGQVWK